MEKMDNLYLPIEIQTIRSHAIQSFDVFFKTGEEEMVLYCANGEVVREEVRNTIQERNIKKLYILKKDKIYYDLYIEKALSSILLDPEISTSVKAKTAYDSIRSIAESLFESPKAEIIQRYKNVIFNIVEYVFKDNDAMQNLINLTTFDSTTYNHSINVGIISTGLAKEFLRDRPNHDFAEMAKGFFLHDIGKCIIPIDILNKKGHLSHIEWELIKRHPNEGIRILTQFNELTEVIKLIVLQHHERNNGGGYPNRLKGDQIHVYSKICSIADTFDGLTSYRPYRKEYSTFDALKIMKKEMFKYFDPELFTKFVKLFRNK